VILPIANLLECNFCYNFAVQQHLTNAADARTVCDSSVSCLCIEGWHDLWYFSLMDIHKFSWMNSYLSLLQCWKCMVLCYCNSAVALTPKIRPNKKAVTRDVTGTNLSTFLSVTLTFDLWPRSSRMTEIVSRWTSTKRQGQRWFSSNVKERSNACGVKNLALLDFSSLLTNAVGLNYPVSSRSRSLLFILSAILDF